ncbi:MAG: DUF2818 family protein [Burkholderiales bacterium]|nr:DUF2818 family protein [Burkholderiales bacterium]
MSLSAWFVIGLALFGANLPFVSNRFILLFPLAQARKPGMLRMVEMALYYVLIGAIAWLLESKIGNVAAQRWEFYAITISLFIVFGFPGFVYCYLLKRR